MSSGNKVYMTKEWKIGLVSIAIIALFVWVGFFLAGRNILAKENIDVEYMYSVFGQVDGLAHMVFRVADTEKLIAVLRANNVEPISGENLGFR